MIPQNGGFVQEYHNRIVEKLILHLFLFDGNGRSSFAN